MFKFKKAQVTTIFLFIKTQNDLRELNKDEISPNFAYGNLFMHTAHSSLLSIRYFDVLLPLFYIFILVIRVLYF